MDVVMAGSAVGAAEADVVWLRIRWRCSTPGGGR